MSLATKTLAVMALGIPGHTVYTKWDKDTGEPISMVKPCPFRDHGVQSMCLEVDATENGVDMHCTNGCDVVKIFHLLMDLGIIDPDVHKRRCQLERCFSLPAVPGVG